MDPDQAARSEQLIREAVELLSGSGSFRLRVMLDMVLAELKQERLSVEAAEKVRMGDELDPTSST
ncbi:hypothetical protein [Methylorubrum thiocyanatum]|uniref:hypothetical protein n=1 Tax=Methylorubrum thiocyanatum TaxID=47958 RepID=UPI003653C596